MALTPTSEIRDVHGIGGDDKKLIKAYLQDVVSCWLRNQPREQFAARHLVGGENRDWSGTPLEVLYEKHTGKGKTHEEAVAAAGRDLGWLLKAVLQEDKRTFEVGRSGLTAGYRWIGNEP